MTLFPFKNVLKEKVQAERELEEAKVNRVAIKNKNGAKTIKRQTLKTKKKLILNCIDNQVPSTSSAYNEARISSGLRTTI